MIKKGILFIISTPIGNREDFSFRAVKTLQSVDLVAAEDTRVAKKLLNMYSISKDVICCNEHNEIRIIDKVLNYVIKGYSVGYMADAGTPLISDPGYLLVKKARELDLEIVPIPGACAAITAISVSGLATDSFIFDGFLPAKSSHRIEKLKSIALEKRTVIFYESTHRIQESLKDFKLVFENDERTIVIAKELTKKFESFYRGSVNNCLDWIEEDSRRVKGEFVILISALSHQKIHLLSNKDSKLLEELLKITSLKQACKIISNYTGINKNIIYSEALKYKLK